MSQVGLLSVDARERVLTPRPTVCCMRGHIEHADPVTRVCRVQQHRVQELRVQRTCEAPFAFVAAVD